jgi:hypothetical protein
MTFTPNAEFSTQISFFIGKFLPELLVTGLSSVWVGVWLVNAEPV